MDTIERSLVLLKPDALDRGLVGELVQRFERVGLKIVGMKLLRPTQSHAENHYAEDLAVRRGEHVRKMMIDMLMSGPVLAIVFEGVESVELIRKMIGSTEPKSAAPGTIRGDYAHVSYKHSDSTGVGIYNLVHASGSPEEAVTEIAVWFRPEELLEDHHPSYINRTIVK